MRTFVSLWNDQRGYLLTGESIFMATILVIGLVAGWKAVNSAINQELEDVANAFTSINQSYSYGGVSGCCASSAGSDFVDTAYTVNVDTCTGAEKDGRHECEEDR